MPNGVASIDDGEWSAIDPEGVDDDWWPGATPLCFRCASPIDRLQHYCHNCHAAVGEFTPSIPFVNIALACEPFCIMWERLWWPRGESQVRRATYIAMLIVGGMVSGYLWILPIALVCWWRRPPARPGFCHMCGYDLRAGHECCRSAGRRSAPVKSESGTGILPVQLDAQAGCLCH